MLLGALRPQTQACRLESKRGSCCPQEGWYPVHLCDQDFNSPGILSRNFFSQTLSYCIQASQKLQNNVAKNGFMGFELFGKMLTKKVVHSILGNKLRSKGQQAVMQQSNFQWSDWGTRLYKKPPELFWSGSTSCCSQNMYIISDQVSRQHWDK